jgi:hypothetical protein
MFRMPRCKAKSTNHSRVSAGGEHRNWVPINLLQVRRILPLPLRTNHRAAQNRADMRLDLLGNFARVFE